MKMNYVENIFRLFKENPNGKISVKVAHAKIDEVVPTLSTRRKGQLLRKCFGKCLKRGKPGPSKVNPRRQWVYYGIELRASTDDGGRKIHGMSLPSSWGKNRADTPPLLAGVDNIIQNVQIGTPPEVIELRERVASLERQLAEQKTRDAESSMMRRYRGRLPTSMLLTEGCLPPGKPIGSGTYSQCKMSKYKEVPVVIKEFKNADKLSQLKLRDSVLEEAMAILNLEPHQNLPQLVGVCLGKYPYSLITQYWGNPEDESLTMFKALRSKRLLGTVPWVKLVTEVVSGVIAIHRSGIVHNDIKDDNIVLHRSLDFSPQIIDFGKATSLKTTQLQTGKRLLSIREQIQKRRRYPWIAPELVSGKETPSQQTDVYSVGFVVSCVTSRRLIPVLKNVEALSYVEESAKRASLRYILQLLSEKSLN